MSHYADLKSIIKGKVVLDTDQGYKAARVQYATMSADALGPSEAAEMSPGAIIYPDPANADADVITTVNYARSKGIAIAVRTGGHQYGGVSSTSKGNLQLDMSEVYKDFDWNDKEGTLRLGISYGLGDLDTALGALHLFVPHGQCTHVHVGGHAQTGGYGLPGRAFGLFADHIFTIRVITADGQVRYASRNAELGDADYNPHLFYGVLGGSPGNFGVLTEITLRPRRDIDHPNSVGYKGLTVYSSKCFKRLLDIKAEMSNNDNLPADFDFCLTVINLGDQVLNSYGFAITDAEFGAKVKAAKVEKAKVTAAAAINGSNDWIDTTPATNPVTKALDDQIVAIICWVEWANLKGKGFTIDSDPVSADYFKRIRSAMAHEWFQPIVDIGATLFGQQGFAGRRPMSKLTASWVFDIIREFNYPYYKRTYVATSATNLEKSGWAEATVKQVDEIVGRRPHCCVVQQIQLYGGKNSNYRTGDPENKTAYSWRRTATVVHVMDAFYDASIKNGWTLNPFDDNRTPQQFVEYWQSTNDVLFKGKSGPVPSVGSSGVMGGDRRVLWGSFESAPIEKYMDFSWPFYYETKEKYDTLVDYKRELDPTGVFSPNGFCVGQAPPPTPLGPSHATQHTIAAAAAAAVAHESQQAAAAAAAAIAGGLDVVSHAVTGLAEAMSWAEDPQFKKSDSKKQRVL